MQTRQMELIEAMPCIGRRPRSVLGLLDIADAMPPEQTRQSVCVECRKARLVDENGRCDECAMCVAGGAA
jgi:hypothetical protein